MVHLSIRLRGGGSADAGVPGGGQGGADEDDDDDQEGSEPPVDAASEGTRRPAARRKRCCTGCTTGDLVRVGFLLAIAAFGLFAFTIPSLRNNTLDFLDWARAHVAEGALAAGVEHGRCVSADEGRRRRSSLHQKLYICHVRTRRLVHVVRPQAGPG